MSCTSESLEVVGRPVEGKSLEVEDFWMARIQSIENQYDEHVRTLERKLLDQRRNARLVASLEQHNARLQGQVTECTETAQGLARRLGHIQSDLKETQRKKAQTESKIVEAKEQAKAAKKELQETIGENQHAVRQRDILNQRLAEAEFAKKKLGTSVRDLENDLGRIRDGVQATEKEKVVLSRALIHAEAEKQALITENQRASQTVRYFMNEREDDEDRLYRMKRELEQVLDQLGRERLASLDIFRHQQNGQKQLQAAQQDLSEVLSKLDANSFETLHWKQEAAMMKKIVRFSSGARDDGGRGRIAQLRERVRHLERKMDDMEKERRQTNAEVKSLKVLHESLTRLQHQNQATRRRLQPKYESTGRFMGRSRNQENATSVRQVEVLQKKVEGLEKELNHHKMKHSVLKMELNGKLGLERELRWTEKALLQADADKIKIADSAATAARQLGGSAGQGLLKQKLLTQIGVIHKLRNSVPKSKEKVEKQDGKLEIPTFRTKEQLEEDTVRVRSELALAERRQAVFNAMQEAAEAKKAAAAALLEEAEEEEDGPEIWLDVDTEEALTSEADFLSSSSSSATSSAKERKKTEDLPEDQAGQENEASIEKNDEEDESPIIKEVETTADPGPAL